MPKVDNVQRTQDDHRGFAGAGFVVRDDAGKLVATFGYLTDAKAREAHEKMLEVLATCKYAKGFA
jgi:hypothetical protein